MDHLAYRVASRYLLARGTPDALLQHTEAAAHRSREILRTIAQQHGFWEKAIAESKPFAEVQRAHTKLMTFVSAYETEVSAAMASIEVYDEAMAHDQGMSDHFSNVG